MNGLAHRTIRSAVCLFIEQASAATCHVPCYHYFDKMLRLALNYEVGVAFYEAGEAI